MGTAKAAYEEGHSAKKSSHSAQLPFSLQRTSFPRSLQNRILPFAGQWRDLRLDGHFADEAKGRQGIWSWGARAKADIRRPP